MTEMSSVACRVKKLLRMQRCRCGQRNIKTAVRRDGTFLPRRQRRKQGDRAPRGSWDAERAPTVGTQPPVQAGSGTSLRAQHRQPCRARRGTPTARLSPVTPLHRWLCCQMLLGTELDMTHQHREGGGNGSLISWPQAQQRGWGKYHCWRAPPTAPTHCGLPNTGFSFFGWN